MLSHRRRGCTLRTFVVIVRILPAYASSDRTSLSLLPRPRPSKNVPTVELSLVSNGFVKATLTEFGNLLETFVVGELRKQVSWLDESATVGHWRTHDGDEVDYVIEFDDGRVLAFEVKANERISGGDFKGLRALREILGDRFVAGVVFSTGSRSYVHSDRLYVLPVDRLWRPVTAPASPRIGPPS